MATTKGNGAGLCYTEEGLLSIDTGNGVRIDGGKLNAADITPIAVRIEKEKDVESTAYVIGADRLIQEGAIPLIFRWCAKRNAYILGEEEEAIRVHSAVRKGWNMYVGRDIVKIAEGGKLTFVQLGSEGIPSSQYLPTPMNSLVRVFETDSEATRIAYVPWGRSQIEFCRYDTASQEKLCRQIHLHFGLGFIRPAYSKIKAYTQADLCSTMAAFSVVVDGGFDEKGLYALAALAR